MPCHATLCHAMPCHAMPCHAMPCHATPWFFHSLARENKCTAGMLNLCLRNQVGQIFWQFLPNFTSIATMYEVERKRKKYDLLQNLNSLENLAGGSMLSAMQLYRPSALLFTLRITIWYGVAVCVCVCMFYNGSLPIDPHENQNFPIWL